MSNTKIQVIPHLVCRNAEEAYGFYQRAFGAKGVSLTKAPTGEVMHAALLLDDQPIYLNDEFRGHGVLGPESVGDTTVVIHLEVPNSDATFAQAVEAGCSVVMPIADMFWGSRYGVVKDPYGHKWSIGTTTRQVSPDEIHEALAGMTGQECAN